MVEFENLLKSLRRDYPELKFRLSKRFKYRPPGMVYYEQPILDGQNAEQNRVLARPSSLNPPKIEQNYYHLQLLHEVGHAILRHSDYRVDIERLQIERAAWDQAKELCAVYEVPYDEDFVEEELDTYRDWLHQRAKCPVCQTVRYQDRSGKYRCPFCETWTTSGPIS